MRLEQRLIAFVRIVARSAADGPVSTGAGVAVGAAVGAAGPVVTGALCAGLGLLDGNTLTSG
jgi:hypothetical protein